jgi:uncharacterized protein with FMN-binding domain
MTDNLGQRDAEPAVAKSPTQAKATPAKRGGARKLSKNLAGLSAAAILAIYSLGYVQTQSAAAQIAAQSTSVVATTSSASTSLSAASGSTGSSSVVTSLYKDGTYTGSGTSRHGGVTATVTIQNGKIVSAAITSTSTRYPASAIASLPSAVVAQQGTNVDLVSGATDSSDAYLQAVDSALQQAQQDQQAQA